MAPLVGASWTCPATELVPYLRLPLDPLAPPPQQLPTKGSKWSKGQVRADREHPSVEAKAKLCLGFLSPDPEGLPRSGIRRGCGVPLRRTGEALQAPAVHPPEEAALVREDDRDLLSDCRQPRLVVALAKLAHLLNQIGLQLTQMDFDPPRRSKKPAISDGRFCVFQSAPECCARSKTYLADQPRQPRGP